MPHGDYAAPYLMDGTHVPIPPDGQFTVPVCTTPERFDKIMNALWYYGQQQDNKFDFDHLVDWIDACSRIVEGCVDFAPVCRSIGLHDDRLTWFPENPFHPNPEVPDGYPFHPFTVVSGSIYDQIVLTYGLGYKIGDVFTDLTKLPVFTNWFDIFANYANMPSLTVNNLFGRGKVRIELLNLIQGGRILVVIDDVLDIFHLHTIEVGRDAISFPPETQVDFIVEVDVEGDGVEHKVAFVWYPLVEPSAIPVSFGGGVRNIELCGFGENNMPEDPCCPEEIDAIQTGNVWLEKIYTLMKNGMIARIKFEEGTLPPDEAAGDCAPDHFDHDEGESGDELVRRNKALCLTVNQYVKALLLKVLRDMNAPQSLVDFVDDKFPDVTVPLTLSNLTAVYPATFTSINIFFDALTDNIDISEVACAMYDGLTGDQNNTFSNFRASLEDVDLAGLMDSFVDLVHASNGVQQNYKDFNTTLNANNTAAVDDYECPCGAPPPSGDCGGFTPVDWNGSGTSFEYMGDCVWRINSGSGSPYNSSVKDLFDRPFYITNPEPELGFPAPGCSASEQIGANGCPDQIGGCNFSTGLWDGCYSTIQWDSGTPNYYKFRLCTELDECP